MTNDAHDRAPLTQHRFDTPDALAAGLADAIAGRLREAIAKRGRATFITSGGTTPKTTLERLARVALAWKDVTVSLADERWVPPSDGASNEAMTRRALSDAFAAHAHFVGLYTGDPTPEDGETTCAARLATIPRPFDVVLLGMGDDGHTASLFPHAPGLVDALDPAGHALCRAIRPPQLEPRMTLTLRTLLDARAVFLLFTGKKKRAVFESALGDGPIEAMPIRAVLRQQRVPLEVYWTPSE
jgi:6-phosphogluconolactonase